MAAVTSTPPRQLHDVRLVRNVLIPLADGVTLAADLHVPDTPGPHPTLISLYPYRKDDVIGSFSAYARHWFARRGYAHLLVDVRGYGGSEGARAESMDPNAESRDAAEVVEWAAAQPWSSGSVGVWGVSYGGLMALAAGAAQPAHLRGIAPVYPFWDTWADIVGPGGIPNMLGLHQWSTMMLAQRLAPPTCRDGDGRWVRVWRERLDRLEQEGLDVAKWQAEGVDYWRDRVLPVEQIEVPMFLVGGWRDLFPQATVDAYVRARGPKQLLVGPWLHVLPDVAAREPVDWLPLLLAFWDRTLLGESRDALPPTAVFVQGAGGWRSAETWPPSEVEWRSLHPGAAGRLAADASDGEDEYLATPVVGWTGGQWDALGTGMGYPLDQGPDDLLSLTYTTEPLPELLELAGAPEATLDVEADGPVDLVAKLVDVAPDGSAALVASGWCGGVEGGPVAMRLWTTAWAAAAGHRLRLSVSCADFPRGWPAPRNARLRVRRATSELRLPTVPGGIGIPFEPPRPQPVPAAERFPWTRGGPGPSWLVEHDVAGGAVAVTLGGGETMELPEGGTLALRQRATARAQAARPEGAAVLAEVSIDIAAEDGEHVAVEVESRASRRRHLYRAKVSIDGRTMLERSWRNF